MLCKNPFIRSPDPKDPKKYKLIKDKGARNLGKEVFPCGQCLPCRINKARNWTHRLLLEALDHGKACFVTLTYDEDNLPPNGTLVPKDVTKFFKRLRWLFDEQDQKDAERCLVPRFRKARYYYCGEYGENTGRPHYHIALFGVCQTETDLVTKAWGNGNVFMGDLNKNSIQYIAGYILKGMVNENSKKNREYLRGRHPEFQRMSRRPAIGSDAIRRIALKSKSSERFTAIRQGLRQMHLGKTLQAYVDKECGFDNDGSDFNDYCLELYREFSADFEDYKTRLVEGHSYKRTQQRKRKAIFKRRKTF